MSVQAPERPAAAGGWSPRTRLLALAAAILAAVYLLAIGSTHPALSGGFVGWSGPVPGRNQGLGPITAAERALAVGLTVRVVCDRYARQDARLPDHRADNSFFGDATSPVVVHYRALGITTSQTLSLSDPVLVMMPYPACR